MSQKKKMTLPGNVHNGSEERLPGAKIMVKGMLKGGRADSVTKGGPQKIKEPKEKLRKGIIACGRGGGGGVLGGVGGGGEIWEV